MLFTTYGYTSFSPSSGALDKKPCRPALDARLFAIEYRTPARLRQNRIMSGQRQVCRPGHASEGGTGKSEMPELRSPYDPLQQACSRKGSPHVRMQNLRGVLYD